MGPDIELCGTTLLIPYLLFNITNLNPFIPLEN